MVLVSVYNYPNMQRMIFECHLKTPLFQGSSVAYYFLLHQFNAKNIYGLRVCIDLIILRKCQGLDLFKKSANLSHGVHSLVSAATTDDLLDLRQQTHRPYNTSRCDHDHVPPVDRRSLNKYTYTLIHFHVLYTRRGFLLLMCNL